MKNFLLTFSICLLVLTSGWSQTGNLQEDWVKSFDENGSRGKHALEKFIINLKSLNVGKDTIDKVDNALAGAKGQTSKSRYGESRVYQFKSDSNNVHADIYFDQLGILSGITVMKGTELIYTKAAEVPAINNNAEMIAPSNQPNNPKKGQLYFNVNDAHFYGWNGSTWKQLDK